VISGNKTFKNIALVIWYRMVAAPASAGTRMESIGALSVGASLTSSVGKFDRYPNLGLS
jgi:hypothetical protein